MTPKRRLALLSLAVALSTRLLGAATLTALVPEDAPLVITAHDLPALVKAWGDSPWARTLQDEQMKKFLAPMRAQMKVDTWDETTRRETGYTVSELLGFATGEVLLVVQSLDRVASLNKPEDLPVLVAIELGDNAVKLEKLILDATKKEGEAPVSTETFAEETIYTQPFTTAEDKQDEAMSWAFADGVGIFSWSKDAVVGAIDALKKGGVENSFSQSERYQRAQTEMGESQVVFFANLQTIIPAVQYAAQARMIAKVEAGEDPGMDPAAIINALGLNALDAVYFGLNIGKSSTDMTGGLTYLEERGIVKLLAYRDGPPPQPEFASARWTTVSTARFSIRDAYAAIEEMLAAFNPTIASIVQSQIEGFNKRAGIDLKRDLIGSLGDAVISANFLPQAAGTGTGVAADFEQFIGISLENAPAFTNAIEALKTMMGPQADQFLKKREYLGTSLFSFEPPANGPKSRGFSYAITPKYLMVSVGSPAMVETALQGSATRQPSIWEKPEVKAALAEMPANACTFQFQDTSVMMAAVLETVARAAAAAPAPASTSGEDEKSEGSAEPGRMVDFAEKPDAAMIAKYWSHASGFGRRDSKGIYFRSKLNHTK